MCGGIWLHNGFYKNYVFNKAKDTTENAEFRKDDEILEDIKIMMADQATGANNRIRNLFVTWHTEHIHK